MLDIPAIICGSKKKKKLALFLFATLATTTNLCCLRSRHGKWTKDQNKTSVNGERSCEVDCLGLDDAITD